MDRDILVNVRSFLISVVTGNEFRQRALLKKAPVKQSQKD